MRFGHGPSLPYSARRPVDGIMLPRTNPSTSNHDIEAGAPT
jgi:hypothetical protein